MAGTRELGKKIAKDAQAEAATAEAEEPTEPTEPTEPAEPTEEQAEEEAEAEREQEQQQTGPSPEQQQKQFERMVGDFRRSLAAFFEVEDLEPSQTPGIFGFVLPGFTEKLPHPNFKRCETCNGHGTVLTGSTREGYREQDCPDQRCSGRGYWQKNQQTPAQPQTLVPVPNPPANGAGEFGPAPTWMGDPNLTAPAQAFTPPTP